MRADVMVVGAGLAGMTAALAAEKAGAEVILIDRGPIGMGTNSALSNGAFSGPISPERADEYVDLVLQIGKRLNRVAYVRQVAREASAAVAFLESLDLEIVRTPGHWLVDPLNRRSSREAPSFAASPRWSPSASGSDRNVACMWKGCNGALTASSA